MNQNNEKMLIEGILLEKIEEEYRQIFETKFTWKRFLCELTVFGESIIDYCLSL